MSIDDHGPERPLEPAERRFEAFLARYWADADAGRRVPLAEYLRDFADIEERVTRELAQLLKERGNTRAAAGPKEDVKRIGSYRLEELLGKGGQGAVYRARHVRLPKAVAVKVLLRGGAAAIEAVKRFEQEAQIGATLSHPAICAVLDAGIADETPYIAMEFVEGETLSQRIDRLRAASRPPGPGEGMEAGAKAKAVAARGRPGDPTGLGAPRGLELEGGAKGQPGMSTWHLDMDQPPAPRVAVQDRSVEEASSVDSQVIRWMVAYFEQVARALHFAHEQGVVHRDLKPGNLMITKAGEPKIMDFGLAQVEEGAGPSLTHTGDILGTPVYMSPEQFSAQRIQVDRRTDIWSLGVTLYECLSLSLPFAGPTREALYQAITFKDPPPLRRTNRAVGRDLRVVVEKCLEKDRDQRYATALELADELARVLKREPIVARPVGPLARTARWAERHPALAIVLALLFVSISSFSALQWVTNRDLRLSQAAAEANAAAARENARRADANARAADVSAREAQENAQAAQRNAEESRRNAEEARQNELRAERALGEYARLADLRRLQNARQELAGLWPLDPKIVEPLRTWQERYATLFTNLSGHRKALEELRSQALPYTEEDRNRDFATDILELSKAEVELPQVVAAADRAKAAWNAARTAAKEAEEAADPTASAAGVATVSSTASAMEQAETALKAAEARIASLREKIAGRGSYSFGEDLDLQFRHDNLASLVTELIAFVEAEDTSAVRNAAARLERSSQIERLTISGPDVASLWAACIQRAHDNDRYVLSEEDYGILENAGALNGLFDPKTRRLRLLPQMGLIPLGPDPTSGLEEFLHLPSHDYDWDGSAVRLPLRRELPAGDRRSAYDLSYDDGQAGPMGRDGIILVLVPGGSFSVGAQKTDPEGQSYDPDAFAEEGPIQRATLRPWLMAKYELTQGQWERGAAFFGDLELKPSQYGVGAFNNQRNILPRAVDQDHPVEQIDHPMAARWLAQMGLELPTEVQWESAARAGGAGQRWAGAATIEDLRRIANISGEETALTVPGWQRTLAHLDAYVAHSPVGRFEGNAYGLYDMTGNVWEWARDGWTNPPEAGRAGDGLRWLPMGAEAQAAQRVSRGGSFDNDASLARVSNRYYYAPTFRNFFLGARASRSLAYFD